jgi:tetratricopeptide (TPR) repeat protein
LQALLDGPAPDLPALVEFIDATGGAASFRQALFREVAYEGLPFRRRRALHLAAGLLLEADDADAVERLSLHFHAAHEWEKSWEYSRRAADRAYTTVAKSAAAVYYERALDAGRRLRRPGDELAQVAADLGRALYNAGKPDAARRAYAAGKRLAKPAGPARASLFVREGVMHQEAGDLVLAARRFQQGLSALDIDRLAPTDSEGMECGVQLLCGLSNTELRRGKRTQAKIHAEAATDVAGRSGSLPAVATAHNLCMIIAYTEGEMLVARDHAERSVAARREDGRFPGSTAIQLMNLGLMEHTLGNFRNASAFAAEAVEILERIGNDENAATARTNLSLVLIDQGRWSEAEVLLDKADAVLRVTGYAAGAVANLLHTRIRMRTGSKSGPLLSDDELARARALSPTEAAVHGVELALVTQGVTQARQAFEQASLGNEPGELRRALGGAIALMDLDREETGRLLREAIASGDKFSAVLIRTLLGGELADDPDAQELGIVDVPVWAKPAYAATRTM